MIWGEMGRTPRVGTQRGTTGGRDHWPQAGFAVLAGGGFATGQAIGATNPRGEHPVGKPYTPQNVLATLYSHLGIDPQTTINDHTGRPMLTIFGKPHANGGFCDGVSRRDFLTIGGTLLGGALAAQPARRRGEVGHPHLAQGHHQHLPARRPAPPRHVGPQARRPETSAASSSRSTPTCPASTSANSSPIARQDDGQVRRHPLAGRLHRRPRRLPVHDRPQPQTPAKVGYWPSMGAWVSKVQGPVIPAVPPHLTLMYRTGEPRWGDPGDGGFLGMAHSPFRLVGGKGAMGSDNMVLKGVTLERLQRPRRPDEGVRRLRPQASTAAARWTAWTRSTARRSASSRRRS